MTQPTTTLSERDLAILAVESKWWQYTGKKEQAVKEKFGVSLIRFYQLVNELIDRDDVLPYDPLLVNRLRRLREKRLAARSVRRIVFEDVPDPDPR